MSLNPTEGEPLQLGARSTHHELIERFIVLANSDRDNHERWQQTTQVWQAHYETVVRTNRMRKLA